MRILITGATGFIGSKIVATFRNMGHEVTGWSRSLKKQSASIVRVDMSDIEAVGKELVRINPQIIIHCAGSADVKKSVDNPEMDYNDNVTVTHNLLFSLIKLKMYSVKVVFLSSAAVYGNPSVLPTPETIPLNPLSPYAVHKVLCEELCNYVISNYRINIIIARVFSAYGYGLRKQIFWDMYQKYKNTGKLEMYGTGSESRDYIHVNDVVQSIQLLAFNKTDHSIYNVANGKEVTIRNAVETFASTMGVESQSISFNLMMRSGDPINWCADISRLKEIGYEQTVDLKDGLIDYYKWVSSGKDA